MTKSDKEFFKYSTGLSYDKSHVAVETVVTHLQISIPSISDAMTQILQDLVQQKVSGAYRYIIRELNQWRWWCQREGLKSDRFRLAKQQLCTCITYISLPSLHNYNMELFNFMFCGMYDPCKRTQHCWMLHVASICTPCCMLLDVVACCCAEFETSQTFQPTTPNISFVPWSQRTLITHGLQRLMGCILPTMHCRSQTCWKLLHPFAHHYQHARNNSQHCWCNSVGSCCARLHGSHKHKSMEWTFCVIIQQEPARLWNN